MMLSPRCAVLTGLIILMSFVLVVRTDYATDEANLINSLKVNYSVEARPQNRTYVFASLLVFALNSVDIGSETMSLSGVIVSQWFDQRLIWDPVAIGIDQVIIKTANIWTPPLVVENEVNKLGVLGADGSPLRVLADGSVVWSPPVTTKTSCSADITYYPYDKQTCTLTLTGWSYTVDEVDLLTAPNKAVDMSFYGSNGEWEVLKTGVRYQNLTEGINTYRKLHFEITFRRKWPYYGQNVILPIVLNSILMALVFAVPIESGEKMGYCLTVLLSYIVLLTMVSDDLPPISSQTSVLQMYLSIVLCIGTASTICTILVLRIYNHDDSEPINGCLQSLTKHVLAPLVCRSCKKKRKVSPLIKSKDDLPQKEGISGFADNYTSKEIAVILDKFFFGLFSTALLFMTGSFVIMLLVNYNNIVV